MEPSRGTLKLMNMSRHGGKEAWPQWFSDESAGCSQECRWLTYCNNFTCTGDAAPCPTFVRREVDGQMVWGYMVPEAAPAGSAPSGLGDGAFKPLPGVRSIVGVVGSAHVRGMVREWNTCVKDTNVEDLLKL